MTTIADRLRDADPVGNDARRLDDERDRIRRTVVSAALNAGPQAGGAVSRRAVLGVAGALAVALTVIGLLFGVGGRGTLQAAVRFEVRLGEEKPLPGLVVARVGGSGRLIYLHPEMIVTNDDIAHSWVTEDGPDRFSVFVELLEPGAQRMRQATAGHIGKPVAILIDGEVVMAPVVRSAIGNSAVISGGYTRVEAERIAEGIGAR
jgi:hypothetical protein